MGLFDYVNSEVPLPDGYEGELQTKDFDFPFMETYTISKHGRLIHHKPRYNCDPPGDVDRDIDMGFHGYLHFGRWDDEARVSHEYRAKFTDGQLVSIEHRVSVELSRGAKASLEEHPVNEIAADPTRTDP
jgi:hypothetical protein